MFDLRLNHDGETASLMSSGSSEHQELEHQVQVLFDLCIKQEVWNLQVISDRYALPGVVIS